MTRFYTLIIFLVLGMCVLIPERSAHAGYDYTRETEKERAIFAYFRAAGESPDYEYWIKNTSTYRMIAFSRRQAFMLDEMTRLGRGFGIYDYDKDVLDIMLYGFARYHAADAEKPARLTFTPQVKYKFATTVEFPYGRNEISLFIDNLDYFLNLELNEVQGKKIETKIPFLNEDFTARLELKVRVTKTDDTRLTRLSEGQVEGRAMIGEIAYAKALTSARYNMEKPKLWDYVAPWYRATYESENMDEDLKYPHPYELYK